MLDNDYSKELVEQIRSARSTEDKVRVLAGRARGSTCVILACGPSLSEYTPSQLIELCGNTVVFALKQAFEYVPEICDFLLLNTWNYKKYDFSVRRPVVLYESGPSDPPVFGEHDIELDIPHPSDLSHQLARSKRFDDYTLDNSLQRPWGPGVLYEVGFYLAHYMGFRNIVTLGWDVGARNTSVMPHFYDRPSAARTRALAKSRTIRSLVERAHFLHDAGVLYNKPRIIPEEVEVCARASGGWYDWLQTKGIDLQVVSTGAIVDERIPRTRLETVLPREG